MSLYRMVSVLTVALLLAGCQDGPAGPDDLVGPEFKKGGTPGPPDAPQYEFRYPLVFGEMGSDCWLKDPNYQRTFYCSRDAAPPWFRFQVWIIDAEGEEAPVSTGTVTFERCMDVDQEPAVVVDWGYCGSNQGRNNKRYKAVYYGEDADMSGGFADIELTEFWNDAEPVWGMRWEYDKGDGKKPEEGVKWRRLAYEGYVYPGQ